MTLCKSFGNWTEPTEVDHKGTSRFVCKLYNLEADINVFWEPYRRTTRCDRCCQSLSGYVTEEKRWICLASPLSPLGSPVSLPPDCGDRCKKSRDPAWHTTEYRWRLRSLKEGQGREPTPTPCPHPPTHTRQWAAEFKSSPTTLKSKTLVSDSSCKQQNRRWGVFHIFRI